METRLEDEGMRKFSSAFPMRNVLHFALLVFRKLPAESAAPEQTIMKLLPASLFAAVFLPLVAPFAHAQVSAGLTGLYKLDQASGSTLTNSGSASGADGAFGGFNPASPGTDPARINPGFIGAGNLDFDNNTDLARLGTPVTSDNPAAGRLFNPGTDIGLSTALWFNADTLAATRLIVFEHESSGTNFGIDLVTSGSNLVVAGRYRDKTQGVSGGSIPTILGSTPLTIDTWYHVAWTRAAGTTAAYNLYLNGVFEATVTDTFGSFDSSTSGGTQGGISSLGSFANSTSTPGTSFDGEIDDVATWNRGVTGQEIAALHAMGRFEKLSADSSDIDNLLSAFGTMSSTLINGNQWQYTTGLVGARGTTGGTANSDAFVILDTTGNGMQIVPEPTTFAMLLGGSGLLLMRRRRR